MLTDPRIAIAVVVVAAITFACRIAPFALLRGRGGGPLVDFLSSAMPLGVMIVLVAYTLDGVGTDPATWLPAPPPGLRPRTTRPAHGSRHPDRLNRCP